MQDLCAPFHVHHDAKPTTEKYVAHDSSNALLKALGLWTQTLQLRQAMLFQAVHYRTFCAKLESSQPQEVLDDQVSLACVNRGSLLLWHT